MKYKGLLLLAIAAVPIHALSQNWELVKEKNGIRIYTARKGNSRYKSIKVDATLIGTTEKLVSVLSDPTLATRWIYRTSESYIVKKLDNGDVLSYVRTDMPWPASDRDVVISTHLNRDGSNRATIICKGVAGVIGEKKGTVRVPSFYNTWEANNSGKNMVHIIYNLDIDPGGSLPAWVVNMFIAKGPFETFQSLAYLLK